MYHIRKWFGDRKGVLPVFMYISPLAVWGWCLLVFTSFYHHGGFSRSQRVEIS